MVERPFLKEEQQGKLDNARQAEKDSLVLRDRGTSISEKGYLPGFDSDNNGLPVDFPMPPSWLLGIKKIITSLETEIT